MGRELQDFINTYFEENQRYSADDFRTRKYWWENWQCLHPKHLDFHVKLHPEWYVFICKSNGQGAMTKFSPYLYPIFANVKFCVQCVIPNDLSWQRALTYEECNELGFNVITPKVSRLPFVTAGNSNDYRQLKTAHDNTMFQFNQQCNEFMKNTWPGYGLNETAVIRPSLRQPEQVVWKQREKTGWDFDSYDWLEKDLYEAKLLAYYNSPKWYAKRDARYLHDGYKCVKCGSANIECHHHTYRRVFRELLTDLVTMCRRCHENTHKEGQRRKGQRV